MYNPQIHKRKSLRLQGFNYDRNGLFFVTICTEMRIPLFGEIVRAGFSVKQEMSKNQFGQIAQQVWMELPQHNDNVQLHEFVLMPNHVHGIIEIANIYTGHSLTEVIRQYKTFSARKINSLRQSPGEKVWQRGFHDYIIQNKIAYSRIVEYVKTNPQRWQEDEMCW